VAGARPGRVTPYRTDYAGTIEEFLRLVDPVLAPGLVDSPSKSRIRRIASNLPASIFGFVGYELRLGSGARGTDFAISLAPRGLDWVLSREPWPDVSEVVSRWQRMCAPSTVWCEFDTSHDVCSAPNVFLAIDRADNPAGNEACVAGLPESVTQLQLGFMLGRATQSARLCAMPMNCEDALAFLCDAGWPGDLELATSLIWKYAAFCDFLGVHLDLEGEHRRALGIELLFRGEARRRQPPAEGRWVELFDRLVEEGLCFPDERAALLACSMEQELRASPIEQLMARTFPSEALLLHGTLCTGLQHVKLVLDSNGSISAKIYLGATLAPSL
jgi:hypothetical protein